jgi:hypothetical protein
MIKLLALLLPFVAITDVSANYVAGTPMSPVEFNALGEGPGDSSMADVGPNGDEEVNAKDENTSFEGAAND